MLILPSLRKAGGLKAMHGRGMRKAIPAVSRPIFELDRQEIQNTPGAICVIGFAAGRRFMLEMAHIKTNHAAAIAGGAFRGPEGRSTSEAKNSSFVIFAPRFPFVTTFPPAGPAPMLDNQWADVEHDAV